MAKLSSELKNHFLLDCKATEQNILSFIGEIENTISVLNGTSDAIVKGRAIIAQKNSPKKPFPKKKAPPKKKPNIESKDEEKNKPVPMAVPKGNKKKKPNKKKKVLPKTSGTPPKSSSKKGPKKKFNKKKNQNKKSMTVASKPEDNEKAEELVADVLGLGGD